MQKYFSSTPYLLQDRAFLGVSTLKELVLRRPHGPESTDDFLQALLEITISDIELVLKSLQSSPHAGVAWGGA